MNTVTLYRPVGQKEFDLLENANFERWPPRLPEQPIFYPVTNEAYAVQIARDWNTKDEANGSVGYVTIFEIAATYLQQFPVKVVGGSQHSEYWIPADRLEEFNDIANDKMVGVIRVIRKFTPDGEVSL